MRHLHESGAKRTLCGCRRRVPVRSGSRVFLEPGHRSVHVTKARRSDCKACLAGGFRVGDHVTALQWSDAHAYEVIAVTAKTLRLRRLDAKLLNGAGSGEGDALKFSPGGFVGHTSGVQRYSYAPMPSAAVVTAYWSERRGCYRLAGSTIVAGAHEHYDFNF